MPPTSTNLPLEMHQARLHHQAGNLPQAEAHYRRILAVDPSHVDALHFLGLLGHQTGHTEAAVELITQAVQIHPNFAEAMSNLGALLIELRRFDAAIGYCRRAIALRPDLADPHLNLGNALHESGQLAEAIVCNRRAVALRPDWAGAHNNLGNALNDDGQIDEAIACFGKALALSPDFPEACSNLANALWKKGRFDEAIHWCRKATALRPNFAAAYNNLANALRDTGKLEEAIPLFRRAVELEPRSAIAHNSLGNALADTGASDEAVASYRKAVELKPDYADAYNNLGNILVNLGRRDEAAPAFERAIQLKPDLAEAWSNRANGMKAGGDLDEAIAGFRQAAALQPTFAEAHSNLLLSLSYHADSNPQSLLDESLVWAARHSEPLTRLAQPHANNRDPDRRLKIGFVSPDLRDHVVGRAVLPLLMHLDRANFEAVCYSHTVLADAMTERIRNECAAWRDTLGLSHDGFADLIRRDGIDILVDLSGHSSKHRLLVFARKPAPVQVTWLGFPGTTGMHAMDYRITDSRLDPPDVDGARDRLYAERSIRLPDNAFCYEPGAKTPDVKRLPALATGRITFGCLNNLCKVTPATLHAWIEILRAIPASDLIIFSPQRDARPRISALFAAAGVEPKRIRFVGRGGDQYFALYHSIDMSLDPFPFTGSTTTCDSLWMGVPVITLAGTSIVSRLSLTILATLRLSEFVAESPEAYVRLAIELANNVDRLAEYRSTLRRRMQASTLMDAPRFARNMEAAFRTIWRTWCGEGI